MKNSWIDIVLRFILPLIILLTASVANAATVTFSWLPNTESNLAGYKIHCGTEPITYTISVDVGKPELINGRVKGDVGGIASSTVYWCAATAYDVDGNESGYSNEVSFALPDLSISAPKDFKYEVNL